MLVDCNQPTERIYMSDISRAYAPLQKSIDRFAHKQVTPARAVVPFVTAGLIAIGLIVYVLSRIIVG